MPEAKRTLVKSAPEIWAEISDPGALARHLEPFGSVRIAQTKPEKLVHWEGDRASGTVRLEPSGFGTRVILTASTPESVAASAAEPEAEPEPPVEAPRRSLWARLLRRPVAVEAVAVAEPEPEPESEPRAPAGMGDEAVVRVLTEALDTLGAAHHRPFSRI